MSAFSQTEIAFSLISCARLRVHEGAAAGGQHVRRLVQQAGDHPPFAVAEGGLAILLEDLGDRPAGRRLDLRVGVAERHAERGRPGAGRCCSCRRPIRPTRAMVLSKGREVGDMTVSGFTRAAPDPPTSPQGSLCAAGWVEAFLEMMAAERAAAANTLTAYAKDLADAAGLPRGARQRPRQRRAPRTSRPISPHLGARGLAPATAARRRAAVRQFYRFVLGERWRADDPVAPGRCAEARPAAAEGADARGGRAPDRRGGARRTARPACGSPAMIELIYASGLRVSEATSLTLAARARDPAYLMVRGKGGKERLAPLNGAARTAIKAYLEVAPGLPAEGRQGKARGCSPRAARAGG